MKNNRNEMSEDLLVKFLLNEVSETEKEQVEQWINENAENKKQFHDLRLILENSKNIAAFNKVNTEEAWEKFKQRTQQEQEKTIIVPIYKWLKIAAIFLLLAGSSGIIYKLNRNNPPKLLTANNYSTPLHTALTDTAKEPICNNTPCPLEICIVQTIQCRNNTPSVISTCSTIEPDKSGHLAFKAFSKLDKNCSSSVQEIRIKRISTGETIVLNSKSKPSTASEVFSYITGQKKGDILAGIFHSDCNNAAREHGLKIDNYSGDLLLQ